MIFGLILGVIFGKIMKDALIGLGIGGAMIGGFSGIGKYFERKKSK